MFGVLVQSDCLPVCLSARRFRDATEPIAVHPVRSRGTIAPLSAHRIAVATEYSK